MATDPWRDVWRRQSSCQGKKQYPSWKAAQRDAALTRRLHKDQIIEPYHCRYCHMVHLGSRKKKKR